MTTRFYLSTERDANPDVLELQTYFYETLEVDMGHQKLKFATLKQIDNLKFLCLRRLKEQKAKAGSWLKEDQKTNFDLLFDFTDGKLNEKSKALFQISPYKDQNEESEADISSLDENTCRIRALDAIPELTGLNISHKLIKLQKPINLRSRALGIEVKFILHGNSCLNILTRSNLSNEEGTLIKFVKTGFASDQRLFLFFGTKLKDTTEIVYLKKTEIPIFGLAERQAENNYIDIKCSIHDNGDQFLLINMEVNQSPAYQFNTKYDHVIPYFEDFCIYFFGEKPFTLIKELRLYSTDREDISQKEVSSTFKAQCCEMF